MYVWSLTRNYLAVPRMGEEERKEEREGERCVFLPPAPFRPFFLFHSEHGFLVSSEEAYKNVITKNT